VCLGVVALLVLAYMVNWLLTGVWYIVWFMTPSQQDQLLQFVPAPERDRAIKHFRAGALEGDTSDFYLYGPVLVLRNQQYRGR
jgi:hypothetical protein